MKQKDTKVRIINHMGGFAPQIYMGWGDGWKDCPDPAYGPNTTLSKTYPTFQEAMDVLKKSKDHGKVMWEGTLNQLQ